MFLSGLSRYVPHAIAPRAVAGVTFDEIEIGAEVHRDRREPHDAAVAGGVRVAGSGVRISIALIDTPSSADECNGLPCSLGQTWSVEGNRRCPDRQRRLVTFHSEERGTTAMRWRAIASPLSVREGSRDHHGELEKSQQDDAHNELPSIEKCIHVVSPSPKGSAATAVPNRLEGRRLREPMVLQ
jgi:hypothetical protein